MIHKNCGGKIVLNCTEMFELISPGIKITKRGLVPGIIQIASSNKNKSVNYTLYCTTCQRAISRENYDDEVLESCSFCEKERGPSELYLIEDSGFLICEGCVKNAGPVQEIDKKNNVVALYGEVIKSGSKVTLLTILRKR